MEPKLCSGELSGSGLVQQFFIKVEANYAAATVY